MTIPLIVLAALSLGAVFGFCWREIVDMAPRQQPLVGHAALRWRNGRAG
jgi:hypothetical protein